MKRRDLLRFAGGAAIATAAKPLAALSVEKADTLKLPEPFIFMNIAGQTVFPIYGNDGCPEVLSGMYLFPSAEEMAKVEAVALGRPPASGYSLCAHCGAHYAAISVSPRRKLSQEQLDQVVHDLRSFKFNTPSPIDHGFEAWQEMARRGQAVHYWRKEFKEGA